MTEYESNIEQMAADFAEDIKLAAENNDFGTRAHSIDVAHAAICFVWRPAADYMQSKNVDLDDLRGLNLYVPLAGDAFERWAAAVVELAQTEDDPAAKQAATMHILMTAFSQWGARRAKDAAEKWLAR